MQGKGWESRCFVRGLELLLSCRTPFFSTIPDRSRWLSSATLWFDTWENKLFLQGGYSWGMRREGVGSSLFLQLLTLLPLCCGDLRCFGSSSFSLSHGHIVSSVFSWNIHLLCFPCSGKLASHIAAPYVLLHEAAVSFCLRFMPGCLMF